MANNQSAAFTNTKNNIAVLDFGLTIHRIIIIDPAHPEEPLNFQKIYLPLRTKKEELEGILKTLLRSYSDYHIRKFIITTSSSFYSSAKETIDFVKRFLQRINKFYLLLPEESNFLINKLFLKLQAGCCMLHQKYGMEFYEIDALIRKHLFPIGVFEFFDHVGVDVMLYSVNNYIKDLTDKEFYEPIIEKLKNLACQGKLGVKTKEGFYNYNNTEPEREKINNSLNAEKIMEMIYSWYLEPVFEVVKKGICTREEIEHIIEEYMNAHQSPFTLAENIGYI